MVDYIFDLLRQTQTESEKEKEREREPCLFCIRDRKGQSVICALERKRQKERERERERGKEGEMENDSGKKSWAPALYWAWPVQAFLGPKTRSKHAFQMPP